MENLYVVNYSTQFNRNGRIFIYEIDALTKKNRIHIGKIPIEAINDNKSVSLCHGFRHDSSYIDLKMIDIILY